MKKTQRKYLDGQTAARAVGMHMGVSSINKGASDKPKTFSKDRVCDSGIKLLTR